MEYQEFIPGDALKPFIKCFYLFETGTDLVFEDKAFATGSIELMFNLGSGRWQTATGHDFKTTAPIELWGQVIEPLAFKSLGKNKMFGIRFYPHTATVFLDHDVSLFNNQVVDFRDVAGKPVNILYAKLLEAGSTAEYVRLAEAFLLHKLSTVEKGLDKMALVGNVIKDLQREDIAENMTNVASRYGITSRYLRKVFQQYTGLSPKLYNKISRFQKSLVLVAKKDTTLTDITYECGYFDQSHFIREFKAFTGSLPSAYSAENSSALLASPNK